MAKKTLYERIFNGNKGKCEIMPKNFADVKAGQKLAIPAMHEIYEYITNIPKGERRTIKEMRQYFADIYKADNTCPIVSGIGVRLTAEYAYQQYSQGFKIPEIAPFWRILDEKSPTLKKLTFDHEILKHFQQFGG